MNQYSPSQQGHGDTKVLPESTLRWALANWPEPADEALLVQPLSGDAGHRQYCRLLCGQSRCMLVSVPTGTEGHERFLALQAVLRDGGVRVPRVYAYSADAGLMLLEDLGNTQLHGLLSDDRVDSWYTRAGELLCDLAALPGDALLPDYTAEKLREEMDLFTQWFVPKLLQVDMNDHDQQVVQHFYDILIASALEQPKVLVHRDYHSRNLMVNDADELVVIDFQDAVHGPITYDVVSLLRDCYIRWPARQVRQWALAQKARQQHHGLLEAVDDEQYLRWFDGMGLQRHIKVMGIFARLHLRDGKSGYLQDLPLVIRYVREVAQNYAGQEPACAAFLQWFDRRLGPHIERAPWFTAG